MIARNFSGRRNVINHKRNKNTINGEIVNRLIFDLFTTDADTIGGKDLKKVRVYKIPEKFKLAT